MSTELTCTDWSHHYRQSLILIDLLDASISLPLDGEPTYYTLTRGEFERAGDKKEIWIDFNFSSFISLTRAKFLGLAAQSQGSRAWPPTCAAMYANVARKW